MPELVRVFLDVNWQLASDGESRPTMRGTLCAAGPIRNAANQETRMFVTEAALADAQMRGLFDNLACFVDHEDWAGFTGNLPRLVGVWGDSEMVGGEAQATLHFYDNPAGRAVYETFSNIVDDADGGRPVPDVGVSLDFYGDFDVQEEAVYLTHIIYIRSGDLVFMPASAGARIHGAFDATFQFLEEDGSMPPEETQLDAPAQEPVQEQAAETFTPAALQTAEPMQLSAADTAMNRIIQFGIDAVINNSGLPVEVIQALQQRPFGTIEAAETAVADAQQMHALLLESSTIQMGGHGSRDIQTATPMDQAENILNWLFGVSDAELPETSMRNIRDFYTAFTGDYEFRGIFQRSQFAGATTTDLPNLSANAMNKIILELWSDLSMYRWFEIVVKVLPNDGSVQDIQIIGYGGTGDLPTVAQKGAYTELTPGDAKESASFVKRGGYVGITLEMIRNSEIQRIQAVPRTLAIDALRTRSGAVAGLFTQASGVGPDLADTNPLFHASGSNVATTAFSKAAWGAARTEIFKHAEVGSGKRIGMFPRYALVPGDLYDTALEEFGYGEGLPTTYNAYASPDRQPADPRPVPLAVPEWTDANDWAAMMDPKLFPTICMSYANAPQGNTHPLPELYTVMSETVGLMFSNDVMPIKVRDWFALGVTGRAGISKRNVA